jgi:predicted Zn finger-like uncharacterized protein
MDALDGNAVAGRLFAVFDAEMTTATTTCANCGTRSFVGELHAYLRAPGAVVRCRNCENVLMVLVEIRGITCVGMPGLAALEPTGQDIAAA